METVTSKDVDNLFKNYPEPVRDKMRFLRQLVHETAAELDEVEAIEETLKWGEPSFMTKQGST